LCDQRWSLIRLDGDMYESTMLGLEHLYPRLSVGGYVIIDDYGAVEGCRRAVEDFRSQNNISEDLERVDWTCVCWKKSGS
jgi:O-methyltransferase